MPTNLPPECAELERKYLEAKTASEKIEALQNYLAAIPKHKGTERLRAQLKTKLAKLRSEEERKKRRGPSYSGSKYAIKKEGAAQVVLLGFTGSGKSSLLKALTNANPEIYGHPFTTTEPIPGMMGFEDVQIQLVEAPALFEGASEGTGWGPRVLGLARNADGLLLVVDLSTPNPCLQLETIINELNKSHIVVEDRAGRVEVERREAGGIQVVSFGKSAIPPHDIERLLRKMRVDHAVVKTWGDAQIGDVAQALLRETLYKPTIVVANKTDEKGVEGKLRELKEAFSYLNIIETSATLKTGLEEIPRRIFESLKIMRIYTKRPGQNQSEKPMIMEEGATVGDAAKMIHKDFYKEFKHARVWGSSKYPGERVGLSYVLKDRDVLEIRV